MSMTVAITGATGFIGSAVSKQLLENGYKVRALARSPKKARDLESLGISVEIGSLEDKQSLIRLAAGADALIHCAGVVRGASAVDFDRVNVDSVERIVKLTRAPNMPKRLLVLSSLAAREPRLSFYAASKHRAEKILEDHASHLSWIALRPPAVYGPGDTELLPLLRSMAKGFAPLAGQTSSRFSLMFVEDLATAVLSWLESQMADDGIYTVHDGNNGGYNWPEVAAIACEISGRRVKLIPIPGMLLDSAAWVNRLTAGWIGYAPMLTPEKLQELRHPDWVCDNSRFSDATNWRPRIQLNEGLRRTPGWLDTA